LQLGRRSDSDDRPGVGVSAVGEGDECSGFVAAGAELFDNLEVDQTGGMGGIAILG
jgi:hypothetical protein